MTFLNPTYLWALLGVLVPIAIHLWSRRKVVTIKVGSTKLLQEAEPKRTSTVRPNELWLMALRILVITTVALILASPQIKKSVKNTEVMYVVESTLLDNPMVESLLKEIPNVAIRVYAKNFPATEGYDSTVSTDSVPKYWHLAQDLKGLPADSIIVLVNGFISGVNGRRPATPSHINWMVLNTDNQSEERIEVIAKKDSFELLTLFSDADKLRFEKKRLPKNDSKVTYNSSKDSIFIESDKVKLTTEEPIAVLIVHTDTLAREQQYISAAFQAVSKFLERPIVLESTAKMDTVKLESYDLSIWLGIKPYRSTDMKRLIFKPDLLADQLIVEGIEPNEYFLTSYLNSENSTSEHLPEKLLWLLNLRPDFAEFVRPYDKRNLSSDELSPVIINEARTAQKGGLTAISTWLWISLLPLMIAERIIAKYRKQ